jgi:hypothetical protein
MARKFELLFSIHGAVHPFSVVTVAVGGRADTPDLEQYIITHFNLITE